METFKEAIYRMHPDKQPVHRALGNMVIRACENFTTALQPILVEGELVYAITSYGSNEILLMHEDDDYPLNEDPNFNVEVLPMGLRKAASREMDLHNFNVEKYGLYGIGSSEGERLYSPKMPYKAYHRALRAERLSKTDWGRTALQILNFLRL